MVLMARNTISGKEHTLEVSYPVESDHSPTDDESDYAEYNLGQGYEFFIISDDEA